MAVIKKDNDFTRLPDEAAERVEKEVAKKASFQEKSLNKVGRKKKALEDKAGESLCVYFTNTQKTNIEGYCKDTGVPFSALVKQLLKEKGIL